MLAAGLPPRTAAPVLEAVACRRFGLAALETRGASRRASDPCASRLGSRAPASGTSAGTPLGIALGGGRPLRRGGPRSSGATCTAPEAAGPDDGANVEAGGGAWLEVAPGTRAWASAPQLALAGDPPPLRRGLVLGLEFRGPGAALALEHRAPPVAGVRGGHTARLEIGGAGLRVWARAEDAPARGALGLAARVRGVEVSGEFESHPLLPSTVRAGFALGGGGR